MILKEVPKVLEDDSESEDNNDEDVDNDENVENEEEQNVYKESSWPAEPEAPKGYTFKGKSKMMAYAQNKIKTFFTKGLEIEISKKKFKVHDKRAHGGATQTVIEIYQTMKGGEIQL